jgi:DNA-binding transcriptional ArsR family regulator
VTSRRARRRAASSAAKSAQVAPRRPASSATDPTAASSAAPRAFAGQKSAQSRDTEVSAAGGGPSVINEWVAVVRRARLGKSAKAVALMMATYADPDGTKVFPSFARLAVETELDYRTVQRAARTLREAGLIEITRTGARRRGRGDEYRLVPMDGTRELRCEVLNPAEVELAKEHIARTHRGSGKWRRARFAGQGTPAKIPEIKGDLPDTSVVQNGFRRTAVSVLPDTQEPPPSIDPEAEHHPPPDEASLRTPRTGSSPAADHDATMNHGTGNAGHGQAAGAELGDVDPTKWAARARAMLAEKAAAKGGEPS